jgi:hypothetical protein
MKTGELIELKRNRDRTYNDINAGVQFCGSHEPGNDATHETGDGSDDATHLRGLLPGDAQS